MAITIDEKAIQDLLDVINSPAIKNKKRVQKKIDDVLAQHGIDYGTFNEILINNEKISDLPDEEVGILMIAVDAAINNKLAYSARNYFSEEEIRECEKYTRKAGKDFKYPFTLNSVLKGSDTLYLTFLTYEECKTLWDGNAVTYNPEVQRLPKEKKNKDGTISFIPDIKPKSVKSIMQLMQREKYKSNSLILNILMDGNDFIEYNDGDLIIHENTKVNIIDGAHRLEAAVASFEQDPDIGGVLPVLIYHLPLAEAQDCLSQVNTFNPFDKTLVKFYGNKKISDQITRELMSIPEFKDRVRIKTSITKKSNYLTNFAILSESIDSVFNPQNTKDRYEITEALKKFFGYLLSAFDEEFTTNFYSVKEVSWINHHNTFVGYVTLAKRLIDKYGENYPVEKIVSTVKSIDFRKIEGTPYNEIIAPQGKVNSNEIKKRIRLFFEKIEI